MRAGQLRHRVVIQSGSASQDSFGQVTQTYAAAGTVWAAVEPLSGREFLDGKLVEAELDTRIRMRRQSGVTERSRITWTEPGGTAHTFEVQAVIEDPTHHREMQLMCKELT